MRKGKNARLAGKVGYAPTVRPPLPYTNHPLFITFPAVPLVRPYMRVYLREDIIRPHGRYSSPVFAARKYRGGGRRPEGLKIKRAAPQLVQPMRYIDVEKINQSYRNRYREREPWGCVYPRGFDDSLTMLLRCEAKPMHYH